MIGVWWPGRWWIVVCMGRWEVGRWTGDEREKRCVAGVAVGG